MSIHSVREKLYDYIRVADDKKLKAIYTILEEDVIKQQEWWKDKNILEELNSRYESWEKGKEKAYSIEDIKSILQVRKKKRTK